MTVKDIRLIVVEDDPIIRFTMVRMLKNRFAEVDSAENGSEGLRKIAENNYDVVITDLQMPVMDGHSMIKEIRNSKIKTPVIICSAYTFEETEKYECKWMSKPIIMDNLVNLIHDCADNI